MFIAVFAVLLIIIFWAIVKNSRKKLYGDFSAYTELPEFTAKIRTLCQKLALPESHGKGVDVTPLQRYINRAYRIIEKKVARKQELFEFEKWLYDNHYLFKRIFKASPFDGFFNLPHSGSTPRVVVYARAIVALSEGKADGERVRAALGVINEKYPLTFAETESFSAALKYALLEKIASVSKKCIYYEKMLKTAVRAKNVAKKYVDSNLYVYYVIKRNAPLADKLKSFMDENAKRYDEVDYAFSSLIVENNVLTSALVTSLMSVDDTTACAKELMPVWKTLCAESSFALSDDRSRDCYLRKIGQLSDKINLDENTFAERLIALADGEPLCNLLFSNNEKNLLKSVLANKRIICKQKKQYIEHSYVYAVILAVTALSALSGLASQNLAVGLSVAILGLIGCILPAYCIINKVFGLFVKPRDILKANYKDISLENATDVVMPVYVKNSADLTEYLNNLEIISAGNKFSNLSFTLLVDFARADTAVTDADAELMKIIKNQTAVSVAVRKRVEVQGKFCGYERKRGALLNYVAYLITGDDSCFSYISKGRERPANILVLDADSTLAPQAVLELVNTLAHPINADYDLLTLNPKTNLYSVKTLFSKRFLVGGGREIYPEYSPYFYNLTGNALFTGKGIFRLYPYYLKLNGRLPENRILSHDILEGALLETGACDIAVFEDVPQNVQSFEDRRLRWARGDVQLLPYLRLKRENGKRIRPFYALIMTVNALSLFYEPYILTLFLLAAFLKLPYLAVFAASLFSLTYVAEVLSGLLSVADAKRLRYFLLDLINKTYYLLESALLLPYRGIINVVVFCTALIRMTVTKKGLLNWKPFAAGTKKEKTKRISDKERAKLMTYATDTYKLFAKVKTDGLAADHFEYYPKNVAARYTSPTDIGFSLIAEVAAVKLGLISFDEGEERVLKTLASVEKLKKWNGHLYNWYDLLSKKPMAPSFVSSVDSGNFIASLLLISEVFGEKTQKYVNNLLENVNFKALFDNNAKQFYIGYNADRNTYEGHYDNLVSEARLLAYLGVCFGLPTSAWDNLSRDYSKAKGNVLLSWGGTAFEYLMSDMFISAPKYSLLSYTSSRAVKIMKNTRCKGLWGISESGYFAFDDNRNYLYKAFGLDNLSLKSELSKCVISPYSSFLALEYAPRSALKNLKKLEMREAYGDLGFYEAVDYTKSPRIVLEYMSHHAGMSLMSIANYLTDGSLRKAFESALTVASSKMLLTENSFTGKTQKQNKNKFIYDEAVNPLYERKYDANRAVPVMNVISNGNYCVVLDDFGCGYGRAGNIDVNVFEKDINSQRGAFFYVTDIKSGKTYSPTRAPLQQDANYGVKFKKHEVEYCNFDKGLSLNVGVPSFFTGERRVLKIENKDDTESTYAIHYYSDLCLNTRENYAAHPAYSNLFVETEIKEGVLYAARRSAEKNNGVFAALYVKGANCDYISNRMNFLGRKNGVSSPDAVYKPRKKAVNDNGTVLSPCFAFSAEITVPAHGVREIEVYTAVNVNKTKLEEDVKRAKSPHFSQFIKKIPYIEGSVDELDDKYCDVLAHLLPEVLYRPYSVDKLCAVCRRHKLFEEISCNYYKKPLLFVYDDCLRDLKQAVKTVKIMLNAGVPVSLVVKYSERDGYYKPVLAEISRAISGLVIGRDVFFISDESVEMLQEICFTDFSYEDDSSRKVQNPTYLPVKPLNIDNDCLFESGEGYFSGRGYEVVPFNERTLLPYSNVIAETYGGTVVSDNGGYTYYGNSRESKLTDWKNDFVTDCPSEFLILEIADKSYRLNDGAHVTHSLGTSRFSAEETKFISKVSQYMVSSGGAKVYEVEITAKEGIKGSVLLNISLTLGASVDKTYIYYKTEEGIIEALNLKNGISCYMREVDEAVTEYYENARGCGAVTTSLDNRAFATRGYFDLAEGESKTFFFVFGGDYQAVSEATPDIIPSLKEESLNYFESISPFSVNTDNKAFDVLFNKCLPYQVLSARINGKTSSYQAGGATGFRDILQDCLALIFFDKRRAREIILDVAAHVYFEGDVQHWWHAEKQGVRTRISDDRLFLPFVVTEYVAQTGDYSVLECEVPYLNSKPLSAHEKDRYENPPYHEKTDTLLLHLERITESAYRTGENGLLLIGGGDWNDALNAVGNETSGESVWLTEFYVGILNRMKELYSGKEKLLWIERSERLKESLSKTYTGRQFKRLQTASGEWLGDGYNKRFAIDIISQAWASLADVCDKKYRDIALNAAKNALVDKDNGIILLLAPPQNCEKHYGTISLYPEGVRENGGQYTHGAIWYIAALIKEGRVDEAYEAFSLINPLSKCIDRENAKKYMAEPYVLAADVYSNKQNVGRAGWTWYTGSASWLYKTMLEGFLGVRLVNGNLEINPKPPKVFDRFTVTYEKGGCRLIFDCERRGRRATFENGVEITAGAIPLSESGERRFKVFY